MINILNRIKLFEILNNLQMDVLPEFGEMTPQHMVEHLALAVRFSNGKEPQKSCYSTDKEQKIKAFVIGSHNELPIGFKSPVLPIDGLSKLEFSNLKNAIENLKIELTDFDNYFIKNSSIKPINPTMGELDYHEWIIFHNKHFTHHFGQFRLPTNYEFV